MATYPFNGKRLFVLIDNDDERRWDLITGIRGIADALYAPIFDDIKDDTAQRMIQGLKVLTDRLDSAAFDIPLELGKKLDSVFSTPESEAD